MKKEKGFGLIEVIVSLSIMSLVVIALASLSSMTFLSWEDSQNRTIAQGILQKTMEDIHNKRDSNVANGINWDDGISAEKFSSDNVVVGNKSFAKKVQIENQNIGIPNDAPAGSEKKITVSVSWKERMGDKKMTSETYLTDWRAKY